MSRIQSVVCLHSLLMLPAAGVAADHPILPTSSASFACEGSIDDNYRIDFVKRHYALDMPPAATLSPIQRTQLPCRRHCVLYQPAQPVDQLKFRRTILANLPSAYIGLNNYWLQK
jgi:hypothetical protein